MLEIRNVMQAEGWGFFHDILGESTLVPKVNLENDNLHKLNLVKQKLASRPQDSGLELVGVCVCWVKTLNVLVCKHVNGVCNGVGHQLELPSFFRKRN